MLEWLDRYYVSTKIENSADIQRAVEERKPMPGIFLITLSKNPHNLCEIVPSVVLLQKAAMEYCPMIIGIAKGKSDAMELVQSILLETYRETGKFDIKEYIKSR